MNNYKLIKLQDYNIIVSDEDVTTLNEIDYNDLEEEFGVVDVEKLAKEYSIKMGYPNKRILLDTFIGGFNKAQELNDKKFSLEDMRAIFNTGFAFGEEGHYDLKTTKERKKLNKNILFIESLKFLQQPKVFDIGIKMEDIGGRRRDSINGCWIPKLKPKIINNKIKITNIIFE